MKTHRHCLFLGLLLVAGAGSILAQDFNSGSNGSYGPLNIAADTTLDVPPDGIFHCTTINVASGKTLRFTKNSLNTPVYLLAQGNVNIAGTIDVSGTPGAKAINGEGGPGGFDGGAAGVARSVPPGDGHGPGGGKGGTGNSADATGAVGGSFATAGARADNGRRYGNALLQPLVGGSGGGGQSPYFTATGAGPGGGGGGGALLVASSTKISLSGELRARGRSTDQNDWYAVQIGAGSGGAIRIVAPVVEGGGKFDASSVGDGGWGRIRIDARESHDTFNLIGKSSRGREMVVFPAVVPRLDFIEVAGQAVVEGVGALVRVQLPEGAPANQVVKIQARDFTGLVPIQIVVTPENGASSAYAALIDMASGNPAQASVPVVIPAGQVCRIYAWTR